MLLEAGCDSFLYSGGHAKADIIQGFRDGTHRTWQENKAATLPLTSYLWFISQKSSQHTVV